MAEYRLEQLDDENAAAWEEFNNASPEGTLFHSLRWKRISEAGDAPRPQYFLLYRDDELFGLLPFVEHDIHFFRGLSYPSGPLRLQPILRDYSDPSAMQFVMREIQHLNGHQRKISYIRVSATQREVLDTISSYTLFPLPEIGDMILDLSQTPPEKVWDSFSAKKGQRKFIRRFDENGFSIAEARSEDDLKVFYRYYEENIRHIGGKVQPYALLSAIRDAMPDETRVTILSDGSLVAGGMFMIADRARSTLYTAFLSLNRALPNTYHPSYYLWWEAMNWARENGMDRVSFGAQHRDETNPRYRVKYDLGARLQPMYSRIVSLNRVFSMGYRVKQRQSAAPPVSDAR